MPAILVKDSINIPVTPIASVVNLLLSEGAFPSRFKPALTSVKQSQNQISIANFSFSSGSHSIKIKWKQIGQCPI